MAALAGFLTLILMAVFVVALIGLFVRMPPVGLTSRKRAAWTMAGCFVAFLILVAIVPADDQQQTASTGSPTPTSPAKAAPKSEGDRAVLQGQSDQLWQKIEYTLQPCDAYVQVAGEAVSGVGRGTTGIADAYEAASAAKRACDLVRSDMYGLKPPPASRGEVKDAYEAAITSCRETTRSKSSTMEAMAKFLDGDQRPSVQVEIKQGMEEGQRQAMRCVLSYMEATEKGGVTMKSVRDAAARAKADSEAKKTD